MDSTANSAMVAVIGDRCIADRGDSRYLWPMRLLAVWLLVGLFAPGMSHAEFRAKARDFKCLTKGVKAEGKHFYIFNRIRKRLREAVEMSRSGDLGKGLS